MALKDIWVGILGSQEYQFMLLGKLQEFQSIIRLLETMHKMTLEWEEGKGMHLQEEYFGLVKNLTLEIGKNQIPQVETLM